MLILQQRLSGIEMKDLRMFSSIRKTNLCTAQRKKNAAKTRKVKKQLTNLQSIVRRGKTLEGREKQVKKRNLLGLEESA